jgi:hypothetical protein
MTAMNDSGDISKQGQCSKTTVSTREAFDYNNREGGSIRTVYQCRCK